MVRGSLLYNHTKANSIAVNIGNSCPYGLEDDLGLSGNEYQLAVSILFVSYCVST
jgi:hypothetical protein